MSFRGVVPAEGLVELAAVQPLHVAAYVEQLQETHSRPSVQQHLAALKMLFDWLVIGQVLPTDDYIVIR